MAPGRARRLGRRRTATGPTHSGCDGVGETDTRRARPLPRPRRPHAACMGRGSVAGAPGDEVYAFASSK